MAEEKTEKSEETTEEKEEEKTEEAKEEENSSEAAKIPQVEEAKKAASDLKAENERREKILEREEKLQDRKDSVKALGGGSPAGSGEEKKEETPKEYKDRVMAGEV